MKLVIDSSAIIGLAKIDKLGLLKNYSFVVSEAVYREVVVPDKPEYRIMGNILAGRVLRPKDRALVNKLSKRLGLGESETIALALELNTIAVLDDSLARKTARSLGVHVKGLLWIFSIRKRRGIYRG
ncbi:MAG: DUF3368 domain-containing protein [Candidatus Njordarchaeota archaeon]